MPNIIRVVGLDMTMSAMGAARFNIDLDSLALSIESVELVLTEKQNRKVVRANSDDLRRSQEIVAGVARNTAGCSFAFGEIPSGSQGARAALSFGVAIGIFASIQIPLIQVMPVETKLASVGAKTATKQEMITWASTRYPDVAWLRARGKPDGALVADNEHLADACAVVHAGMQTEEFKRFCVILRINAAA